MVPQPRRSLMAPDDHDGPFEFIARQWSAVAWEPHAHPRAPKGWATALSTAQQVRDRLVIPRQGIVATSHSKLGAQGRQMLEPSLCALLPCKDASPPRKGSPAPGTRACRWDRQTAGIISRAMGCDGEGAKAHGS